MAQRWHGLLLLLAHTTQQGRAGQALAIAAQAGQSSTGNGISKCEMFCLKKKFKVFCKMVLTFQKLCAYNRIVV
jgi:hypothetical protein